MRNAPKTPPGPTAWLWWAAVATLLLGGAIAYLMHAFASDPESTAPARLLLAATIAIAGIFVISATARWWLHR